jgi:putative endonuclease
MDRRSIGTQGEEIAAQFLMERGYQIVSRNFHCRFGEVDIIARKNEYLVFVEVKLRKNTEYGAPREYVTFTKQKKIKTTAAYYLTFHQENTMVRFDVIEIIAPNGTDYGFTVHHLENAFQ